MRVLLVNPSHAGKGNIPINLPLLIAVLRKSGHVVRVFDFSNYSQFQPSAFDRESGDRFEQYADKFSRPDLYFKPVTPLNVKTIETERDLYAKRIGLQKSLNREKELWESDPFRDFESVLTDFQPDIVGISALTDDVTNAVQFICPFKKHYGFRVVCGGVHARVIPESLTNNQEIDALCIGEGEKAFPEFINRIENAGNWAETPNMWVRKDGEWVRNELTWITDMSELPVPELDMFDPIHFFRPFNGKLYKMLNYEWNRGCPYSCTFCVNSFFNEQLKREFPGHSPVRTKPIDQAITELQVLIGQYQFEFIRFWDEDFLAVSTDRLKRFAEKYSKMIGLPFLIYARLESIKHNKLKVLKDMGCTTIASGIESGSEFIRRAILNRRISNTQILDKLTMVHDMGIRASCYNIMGLPGETRERVFETIRLNRVAPVTSVSCTLLEPYPKTPIRQMCENDGLAYISSSNYQYLHGIPHYVPSGMSRQELLGLFQCFPLYTYLPDQYFPEIRMAEGNTSEARAIFQELMTLKISQYPDKPIYMDENHGD